MSVALACNSRVPPPPALLAIEPNQVQEGQSAPVHIRGDHFAALTTADFGDDGVSVNAVYGVLLGDTALLDPQRLDAETLAAVVPGTMPAGVYPLTVIDPRGRSANLPNAFTVLAVTQECVVDDDCNDDNVCTGVETCVQPDCQPGTPLDCSDTDPCTLTGCDAVLGCTSETAPFTDADSDGVHDCQDGCLDADGDGYGDPGGGGNTCAGPDCDDDPAACGAACSPGQVAESCDGFDNDCQGGPGPDELDQDGDGFSVCQGDCDDVGPCGSACNPGASEGPSGSPICTDGFDNDCDGSIDIAEDAGCSACAVMLFTPQSTTVHDATLDEALPTTALGAGEDLWVGEASPSEKRALIYFDVAVLSGVSVLSATLTLRVTSGGGSSKVGSHRMNAGWDEATVTWSSPTWSNPGAEDDYEPTASEVVQVSGGGTAVWDVAAIVRDWLESGMPNHGLMLTADRTSNKAREFYASEQSGPANRAPMLEVGYCP